MKMGNWSLVLVTSITVGSGPSKTSSLVAAQCPVEGGASKPGKLVAGGVLNAYQEFPYLEGLVTEQYKWWEAPEDIYAVKISVNIKDFALWVDEADFFNIFVKIEAAWEDFRLLTVNMTRSILYISSEGGIWTPNIQTNWIEDDVCRQRKSIKVLKNNSLILTQNLQLKRRYKSIRR